MRLLKQVRLFFQEGTSDKVYEIDLCELGPGRCVVNYRFGRRGSRLREGSHTAAPVSLTEAERAFEALERAKRAKGYRDLPASAGPTSSPSPGRSPARPAAPAVAGRPNRTPAEFREAAVLRRLQAGPRGSKWPIERAIWRAGELRVRGAAPVLVRLLGGGALRDYCIVWALGRLGDEVAVEPLVGLWRAASTPEMVRRLAVESLRLLGSDAMRAEMARDLLDELPVELRRPAQSGNTEALLAALNKYVTGSDASRYDVLETLYLIDTEAVRPALLSFLRSAPLRGLHFARLRFLFKAAELRSDGELFGLLAYRFAKESAATKSYGSRGRTAYAATTRGYLQLRVWRRLRRLGGLGDRDYIKMAVGVLLPFSDADAVAVRSVGRNHWGPFAPYWALNHILYGKSPRFRAQRNAKAWRCQPGYRPDDGAAPPHVREESFPALWTEQPAGLLHLLAESACAPVHEFAAKALRACPKILDDLDTETLLLLLSRPYAVTAQLGCDVVAARYQPLAPDLPLVLAVANCVSASGRALAHRWIAEGRGFFVLDGNFLFALCTSPHADTRAAALQLLRVSLLPEAAARALCTRLIASLLGLSATSDGPAQARDIGEILLRGLGHGPSSVLRSLPMRPIFDLLRHPLGEVQGIGASLLLHHEKGVGALSRDELDALLRALVSSSFAPTRRLGLELLAQVSDDRLREQQELLRTLCTHPLADLREAARPLIRRLAAHSPAFAQAMLSELISVLRSGEPHEGVHAHVLRLLREDLPAALATLPLADVLALCDSDSTVALELAGHLLCTHSRWAEELGTSDIVRLAQSEVLAVREAAHAYLRSVLPRIRGNPEEVALAVRIVESRWPDSRDFGFRLLREELGEPDYTPEILVGICDSVKPEVQALGRELITRYFHSDRGPEYLLKLSEHPSTDLQLFATNYLETYAAGQPARLQALQLYFISVLSRVNQARLAKLRVHAFLRAEAGRSIEAAALVVDILSRVSATVAIGERARSIETLLAIHALHPALPLPLALRPPPLRAASASGSPAAGRGEGRGAV